MPRALKPAPRKANPTKVKAFVEAKMEGKSDTQAAAIAGYSSGKAAAIEGVRAELQAARRWLTDITQIKRLDVVEGIIDGIEMARHLGDAGNVIKGWVEVAKLLGYSQPETKQTNITVNQMVLRNQFEGMSIEELLAIGEGRVFEHGT